MTTYTHMFAIILAITATAACATESDTPDDGPDAVLWPVDDAADSGGYEAAPQPTIDAVELFMPKLAKADICTCATDECIAEQIDEAFGCDVCLLVACPDGPVGGCVLCPEHADQRPASPTAGGDDPLQPAQLTPTANR